MQASNSAQVLSFPSPATRGSQAASALGRYDVFEELARGGMGAVFRAHDRLLDRAVALKRLSCPRDPALRARLIALFQSEYETLAQLAHPRIVEAFEYGIDAEGPYYTMELLLGGDLSKAAPLPFAKAAPILRDVASALALVHARRFVHRDLSPANVRLTPDGRAKLIDFGALASFGVPREIVGTPAFVAPECLTRAALDQRADLYALGALAYWCVTGKQAVRASSMAELPAALERPVVPPSEYAPDLPKPMEELIVSLLNHDPLARPGSAAEVMDRLTALANLPHEEQQVRVAESYLAHPPLVGRSSQLEIFSTCLSNVAQGRGAALWIEAERGLGRTALLDVYARRTQIGGALLLRTRARSQTDAFSVVRSLLRTALAIEPRLAAAHPEVTLFSASGDHASRDRSAAEGAERNAKLLASAERCLLDFAAQSPLVLMLDDAENADPESLGVLAALAHRAKQHALLILISAASGETLADAHAHARLVEDSVSVALTPFDLPLLVELTSAIFGPVPNIQRLSLWLREHGGANPQRCLRLARLLLSRGEIQYLSGTFSLPYDVRGELHERELEDAMFARVAQLSAPAQQIASLLSAFETPVSLEQLGEVGQLAQRELLAALSELTALGVVMRVDERYSFSHDSLRSAVLRLTSPETMHALHARIGRTILTRPEASLDDRCRAAYHLLRGGAELEGIGILGNCGSQLSRAHESLAKAVPALELALERSAQLGRSDLKNAPLLIPLCLAGFYRDPRVFALYFRRALHAQRELSGVALAARLQPYLGGKLGLIVALLVARIRYARLRDTAIRKNPFQSMLLGLFAICGTGTSAAAASFDFELNHEIGESLAPFRALKPSHPANVVRRFSVAVAEMRRGSQELAEPMLSSLLALLSAPERVPKLDSEVRVQMLIGVQYALGMLQLLRASDQGPAWADAMDKEQRNFFAPHAELLRMLHHALRGDQQAAEPHRERTERLALLGGSGWAPVNNTAHRAILVYEWTEDSMALLRVLTDLRRFVAINPAVLPHIEVAEAYLEFLRGRPEQALQRYEQVFKLPVARHTWTWLGDRGRYAEVLNAVGHYEQARKVCQEALAAVGDGERAYQFLAHVPAAQWALADAHLGDHAAACTRLDALLDETVSANNPLLLGVLHRRRAQVALLAADHAGFEQHLRAMVRLFRATKNPALIRQCERLYASGVQRGFAPAPANDGDPFPLSSLSAIAFRSVAQLPDNDTSDQTEIVAGLGDVDETLSGT